MTTKDIFTFFDKIIKLNPEVDFTDVSKRITKTTPINFYHGSYLDITNVALLMDILDNDNFPSYLQNVEITSFAQQALSGVFFHSDLGHAKHELQNLPEKVHHRFDRINKPFGLPMYVHDRCLYNKDIFNIPITIKICPICIYDGSEVYLQVDDKGSQWYHSNTNIHSKEKDSFFLEIIFHYRKLLYQPIFIFIFNSSTHSLARIMKEYNMGVFSLYESDDGDSSGAISYLLPTPLSESKYIMTGRGCVYERKNDDQITTVKKAYYFFTNYDYIGMTGELKKYASGTIKQDYCTQGLSTRFIFKRINDETQPVFKQFPFDYFDVPIYRDFYEKLQTLNVEENILQEIFDTMEEKKHWLITEHNIQSFSLFDYILELYGVLIRYKHIDFYDRYDYNIGLLHVFTYSIKLGGETIEKCIDWISNLKYSHWYHAYQELTSNRKYFSLQVDFEIIGKYLCSNIEDINVKRILYKSNFFECIALEFAYNNKLFEIANNIIMNGYDYYLEIGTLYLINKYDTDRYIKEINKLKMICLRRNTYTIRTSHNHPNDIKHIYGHEFYDDFLSLSENAKKNIDPADSSDPRNREKRIIPDWV